MIVRKSWNDRKTEKENLRSLGLIRNLNKAFNLDIGDYVSF